MITSISNGNKPKIVKAEIFLLSQVMHLKEFRPDLLRTIGLYCTGACNEVFIEFRNAPIARYLDKKKPSFATLRRVSADVDARRCN